MPRLSIKTMCWKDGNKAAKSHRPADHTAYAKIRPRVFICDESHIMLVAGIGNILELKYGIDEEAAGARRALSLDIFYATH